MISGRDFSLSPFLSLELRKQHSQLAIKRTVQHSKTVSCFLSFCASMLNTIQQLTFKIHRIENTITFCMTHSDCIICEKEGTKTKFIQRIVPPDFLLELWVIKSSKVTFRIVARYNFNSLNNTLDIPNLINL